MMPDQTDPPESVDEALRKAQAVVFDKARWTNIFKVNAKGQPTASLFNALVVFDHDVRWRGVIAFDEFSYRIVKRKTPPTRVVRLGEWSDLDDVQAVVYIAEQYGFEPKKPLVMDAVMTVAYQNAFHPVREWLRGLVWDGTPRLADLAGVYLGGISTAGSASLGTVERIELGLYLKLLSVKWLVGAVARIMEPGCKLDTMPVMEGNQGTFKSTALRVLFGSEWFNDSKLVIGDKDALASMLGKWCTEMAEMDSHRKADDTTFKQFLSTQIDRVRWHYGRRAEDVPRQSVFVGTTNMSEYGKDDTGLRRIWPFEVGDIDLDALRKDREQLWAEAVKCYDEGVSWWVDGRKRVIDPENTPALAALFAEPVTERDLFDRQAQERMQIDAWQYPIQEWLRTNNGLEYTTTAELLGEALKIEKSRWTKPEQMRVAAIIKRLGFTPGKAGPRNARFRAFYPPLKAKSNDLPQQANDVPCANQTLTGNDDDLPI
jgi:putative DNA primase/helicase